MKMTQQRKYVVFLSLAVFMLLVNICASAQVSVLTQHNNNQRTGANLNETTLNTSNVNGNQFGLLFKLAVDDQVWASPLYVAALSIGDCTQSTSQPAMTVPRWLYRQTDLIPSFTTNALR